MMTKKITVILLVITLLVTGCQHQHQPLANQFFTSLNVNSWLQAYEAIDRRINGGLGYANHLDTIGYLSWRQSRVLQSYLNVYQATQDARWLEKFIQQADLLLSHRDDRLWGGAPTWSTLKYLRTGWKTPEPLLVNNAMIIYPLAKFAAMVLPDKTLQPYHNVALWYLNNVIETVDYFQQWYVADEHKGYYIFQEEDFVNHPGINAPFNWNSAMGMVLLALFDATGEESYLAQAKAIAETLKAGLDLAPNGSYRWRYWFGAGLEIYKSSSDISHGALDVRFAALCFEHSVVFVNKDIKRFATTLKNNIWNGEEFTSSVWGVGKVDPSIADTGIFWIGLGKYDREVLELIKTYIAGKRFSDLTEYKWNWYMLAIAEMMRIEVDILQHENI